MKCDFLKSLFQRMSMHVVQPLLDFKIGSRCLSNPFFSIVYPTTKVFSLIYLIEVSLSFPKWQTESIIGESEAKDFYFSVLAALVKSIVEIYAGGLSV